VSVLPRSFNCHIDEVPQWKGAVLTFRHRCHTYEDRGLGSSVHRQALIVVPVFEFDGVKSGVLEYVELELAIVPPESRSLPCSSKHRFDL
jgi:hypothetical protein